VSNHIIALVMVTENNDSRPEGFTRGFDLCSELLIGHDKEIFERPDLFEYD
jgi:hypothetical protein